MGYAKRKLMSIEDLQAQADAIALEAGAIEECKRHSGTYLTNDDADATSRAYAIATNLWKQGNLDGTRKEVMDAIQNSIRWAADQCPSCDKLRRE